MKKHKSTHRTLHTAERDEAFTLSGESLPALVVGNEQFRLFNGMYRNTPGPYPPVQRARRRPQRVPRRDPDDDRGMRLLLALLATSLLWLGLQLLL